MACRSLDRSLITVHVEDEHAAIFESGQRKLAPVIGETAVVRFVASTNGGVAGDFAIVRRSRLYIDRDQFARVIAQAFHTERPNIDELFLAVDASK